MLTIKRIYLPTSTVGFLYHNQKFLCFTIELPDRQNQFRISCIPEGVYDISLYLSQKNGKCIAVHDVPNRDGILIHAGNAPKDSLGCILPVTTINTPENGLMSVAALKKLLEIVAQGENKLTITTDNKQLIS